MGVLTVYQIYTVQIDSIISSKIERLTRFKHSRVGNEWEIILPRYSIMYKYIIKSGIKALHKCKFQAMENGLNLGS